MIPRSIHHLVLLSGIGLVLHSSALRSDAEIIVHEGFNYVAGESVAGQNDTANTTGFGTSGWTDFGNSDGPNQDTIAADSLEFGGLLTSGGASKSISATDGGSTLRRSLSPALLPIEGQTVWISFLMRLDSSLTTTPGSQVNGLLAIDPNSTNDILRVGVDLADSSNRIGIHSNKVGFTPVLSSTTLELGETYFLALSITFHSSVDIVQDTAGKFEEEVHLYINPTPGLIGPNTTAISTTALDISRSGGSQGVSRVARVEFLSGVDGDVWLFDELRFGASYLDVAPVPEPATGLLGLVGLGLAFARRRFRP